MHRIVGFRDNRIRIKRCVHNHTRDECRLNELTRDIVLLLVRQNVTCKANRLLATLHRRLNLCPIREVVEIVVTQRPDIGIRTCQFHRPNDVRISPDVSWMRDDRHIPPRNKLLRHNARLVCGMVIKNDNLTVPHGRSLRQQLDQRPP